MGLKENLQMFSFLFFQPDQLIYMKIFYVARSNLMQEIAVDIVQTKEPDEASTMFTEV